MDSSERLLRILDDLTEEHLRAFSFYLRTVPSLPNRVPHGKLDGASRVKVAELLIQYFPGQELDVTAQILRRIPRMDLLEQCSLAGQPRGEPSRKDAAPPAAPCEPPRVAAPAKQGGLAQGQPRQVSDKELMTLAKNMGKNWKQIGIEFLGVKTTRLEQIEEENQNNAAMRAFYVLADWRNRERERATAAQLYVILNQEGVPLDLDAYAFLLENA